MKVIKRNGTEVPFDYTKIKNAIEAANACVAEKDRLSDTMVGFIVGNVEKRCDALGRAVSVEEIQDMIVDELDQSEHYRLARRYSDYRLRHELLRKQSSTDAKILSLLRHDNELAKQENANKDPVLNSTMRDYLASEVSEDICRRYIFPEDVIFAHDEGIIHVHDMGYVSGPITNCELVNLEDIGIRKHVGSETPNDIMKSNLVQDISYSYNVSDNTTSYSLSLYQKSGLALGDELKLFFEPLGIDSFSRIVGWEWNPFNYKEVQITVGQYLPTINDSLFSVIDEVQDITETTAKYTVEFGELIGNGSFYFTRAYRDRPYFMIQTNDGAEPVIELTRREGSAFGEYIGAKLSGVSSTTVSVVVFYCTIPEEEK